METVVCLSREISIIVSDCISPDLEARQDVRLRNATLASRYSRRLSIFVCQTIRLSAESQ